ncbi:MAG: helix-turn-helix transcriptional regulator [Halorhodospira sp.]
MAARLRAARAVLGMSQKALAEEAGVALVSVNLIERQESSPRLETVEAIEAVFRAHGIQMETDRDGQQTLRLSPELIQELAERRARGEAVTARGKIHRSE